MKQIILLLVTLSSFSLFSQKDSHYSQYIYNMNIVNPAYAGIHKSVNFRVFSRQQWVGISGAPSTHTFTVQSPLGSNLGGALSFVADKVGPASRKDVFADLSYTIQINPKTKLAFGLKGGYMNLNKDLTTLKTDRPQRYDNSSKNLNQISIGAGTFYFTKQYYLGLSFPYLLKKEILLIDEKHKKANNNKQNYFVAGGYVIELNNGSKIKPSFMYRGIGKYLEFLDVSLNTFFTNGFEVGISYRTTKSMSFMINYKFGTNNHFRIGYAYERGFSELSEFSRGSHEIMLMYDLKLSSKKDFAWRGVCF